MTSIRSRIDEVQAQQAVTMRCSTCTRPWQRPAGMTEKRCPPCAARRGAVYRSPSEQLAVDVTRYRLAIEEATDALRSGMPGAALRVLLTVEAPGRAVAIGRIIGPPRQGFPDERVQLEPPPVPPAAPKPTTPSSGDLGDEADDPISLVRNLALGAYKPTEKRGSHGRRRR